MSIKIIMGLSDNIDSVADRDDECIVAIVTGAGKDKGGRKSMGTAICEALLNSKNNEGKTIKVVGVARHPMEMDHPNYFPLCADVTEKEKLEEVFETAEKIGRLDLVVVAAGSTFIEYAMNYKYDAVMSHLNLNVQAVAATTMLATQRLAKHNRGTIFLFSSIVTDNFPGDHAIYTGTKSFAQSYGKCLSKDPSIIEKNIRVMVIKPGIIDTGIFGSGIKNEERREYMKKYTAKVGGGLKPEVVADHLVHAYTADQNVHSGVVFIKPSKQPE